MEGGGLMGEIKKKAKKKAAIKLHPIFGTHARFLYPQV
jgi:hypothetical protein